MKKEIVDLLRDEEFLEEIHDCDIFENAYDLFAERIEGISEQEVMDALIYIDEDIEKMDEVDLECVAGGVEVSTVRLVCK